LGDQDTESGKELVVNCMCTVEESADDPMDSFDAFCGDWRAVGFIMGEMGSLAIDYFTMLVMRELALGGHGMLVLGADIADLSWHQEVT
jgi:hypothetical protein